MAFGDELNFVEHPYAPLVPARIINYLQLYSAHRKSFPRSRRKMHFGVGHLHTLNQYLMNTHVLKKCLSLRGPLFKRLTVLPLMLFVICSCYAQSTVSGKVTSATDGNPIPGANILVKGTSTGTISDAEGN